MSAKRSRVWARTRSKSVLRRIATICCLGLIGACAAPAGSPADQEALAAEYGYVLICVISQPRFGNPTELRSSIRFANYDSDDTFTIPMQSPYSAGVNTYLILVPAHEGRYYMSQYVPVGQVIRHIPPLSKSRVAANDIFEVRAGVINYVGDWDVRENQSNVTSWPDVNVTYRPDTLQSALRHFPVRMGSHETYISIQGRQAISFDDFSDIVNRESESVDEPSR